MIMDGKVLGNVVILTIFISGGAVHVAGPTWRWAGECTVHLGLSDGVPVGVFSVPALLRPGASCELVTFSTLEPF